MLVLSRHLRHTSCYSIPEPFHPHLEHTYYVILYYIILYYMILYYVISYFIGSKHQSDLQRFSLGPRSAQLKAIVTSIKNVEACRAWRDAWA